jgi:hypothetical protein
MNKRFLWICIVLMALVLVVGCEEGSTTSQQLSEEQESLLSESMVALVPILFSYSDLSRNSLSFDKILPDDYDTTIENLLGETPHYVCSGTEIEGSISTSGCEIGDIYGDNEGSNIVGTTEIAITYNITVTGTTIPGGTATLVITVTGQYADFLADDADDEDFDVTISINGQQVDASYSDLIPED